MRRTLLLSITGKRNPANVHIACLSGQNRSRLISQTLQRQLWPPLPMPAAFTSNSLTPARLGEIRCYVRHCHFTAIFESKWKQFVFTI
jgi:hypothetical protein